MRHKVRLTVIDKNFTQGCNNGIALIWITGFAAVT